MRRRRRRPAFRIPAPVPRAIGLGDAVKEVTKLLRLEPCGGCRRRGNRLNGWVELQPLGRRRGR